MALSCLRKPPTKPITITGEFEVEEAPAPASALAIRLGLPLAARFAKSWRSGLRKMVANRKRRLAEYRRNRPTIGGIIANREARDPMQFNSNANLDGERAALICSRRDAAALCVRATESRRHYLLRRKNCFCTARPGEFSSPL